jgi:hypothetical protein
MNLDHQKVEECLRRLAANAPEYTKKIPPPVLHAIQRYVATGAGTGHFVDAVMRNDLFDAVARADAESLAAFREIIWYVYNQLDDRCWGPKHVKSAEVEAWREKQGTVGMEMAQEAKCASTSTSTTSTDS